MGGDGHSRPISGACRQLGQRRRGIGQANARRAGGLNGEEPALIEVDIAHEPRRVGVFLDALEELVEFLFQHLAVRFLRFHLFWKTSSRRASSPFSFTTSAAKSSISLGLIGEWCGQ